jgi:hypothetical protein
MLSVKSDAKVQAGFVAGKKIGRIVSVELRKRNSQKRADGKGWFPDDFVARHQPNCGAKLVQCPAFVDQSIALKGVSVIGKSSQLVVYTQKNTGFEPFSTDIFVLSSRRKKVFALDAGQHDQADLRQNGDLVLPPAPHRFGIKDSGRRVQHKWVAQQNESGLYTETLAVKRRRNGRNLLSLTDMARKKNEQKNEDDFYHRIDLWAVGQDLPAAARIEHGL